MAKSCRDFPKDAETGFREFSGLSQITDKGLVHLKALKDLKWLSLSGCSQITDVGLKHLSGMERLEKLDLRGCPNITEGEISNLARKRPNLVIIRK